MKGFQNILRHSADIGCAVSSKSNLHTCINITHMYTIMTECKPLKLSLNKIIIKNFLLHWKRSYFRNSSFVFSSKSTSVSSQNWSVSCWIYKRKKKVPSRSGIFTPFPLKNAHISHRLWLHNISYSGWFLLATP